LAEALGEATQGDLATKGDLASVRNEIAGPGGNRGGPDGNRGAEIRTENRNRATEIRTTNRNCCGAHGNGGDELLKWITGAVGFQTVVILGTLASLIKILAK
jgi:hypothetical protein